METKALVNPVPIRSNADDADILFAKTVTVTNGAVTYFYNANAPFAFDIIWFSAYNTSADGGTLTLYDGNTAIISSIVMTASDKYCSYGVSIDDAYNSVAASGTVECHQPGHSPSVDCVATIWCRKT